MKVDYKNPVPPADYVCSGCGASGCKQWRPYQTVCPDLLCCDCAGKSQGKDVSDIDANGRIPREEYGGRSDQIGWYIPAVPDEQGIGYWGYTAVPDAGCDWWYALPTRAAEATTPAPASGEGE